MIEQLKEKLSDAELVLVGIGEEWEIKSTDFETDERYVKAVSRCGENSPLIPYIQKLLIEEKISKVKEKQKAYEQLAAFLKDKNYFLVSLCTDGLLHEVGFKEERIVEPCGTVRKMQCSEKCSPELYEAETEFLQEIKKLLNDEAEVSQIKTPVCPECGKPLVLNTILAENYAEEGYLDKWQIYTKWLQGTVNKRVCILELGVGMRFPTVIRWPFEKVAFFNQKSSFFRVHSKLYQITEEIKDRSYGIKASPEEFIAELF